MPVIDGAGASAGIDASAIASVNNVTNDTASEPVSLSDDGVTSSATTLGRFEAACWDEFKRLSSADSARWVTAATKDEQR